MRQRSSMMRQIFSVPELMEQLTSELEIEIENLIRKECLAGVDKIILTGCGDSLGVGMAVKYAFMEYTHLTVEVVPAIELSRYYQRQAYSSSKKVLTIAISNSGNVSRIIEAAKRVRKDGGQVLAITGNSESMLAQSADEILAVRIPKFDYAPGIRSYCGCLLAAYQLALAWGRQQGKVPPELVTDLSDELKQLPEVLKEYLEPWEESAREEAKRLKHSSGFELIGSGCHYANAWFGYAKSLECTGKHTSAISTEDWFHMNYFIKDVSGTGTIVFANKEARDASRIEELIEVVVPMGRPVLFITDDKQLAVEHRLLTPPVSFEGLQIFIQYLPVSMLFSHLGDMLGEEYFRAGKDNWSACVDFATVAGSREVLL